MQVLIMAAQLITGISILVILHELGHFWAARAFGIKVEKFYLFFDAYGKKLFSTKIGETEYGIGWLPLGGYVKIAGMIDESMDTAQMDKPAEPWEFRSKPAWQRLIVMVGGVVMNVIAAIVIFAMIKYAIGEEHLLNTSVKHGIQPSEVAAEFGFKKGDKLIAVNGKPIHYFTDALNAEILLGSELPAYTINRDGRDTTITLPQNFLDKLSSNAKSAFFSPRMEVYVKKVIPGTPAERAGLKPEDHITGIDSVALPCFDEFQPVIKSKAGQTVSLMVQRDQELITLPVEVTSDGTIGFQPYDKSWGIEITEYSFLAAFPAGWNDAMETLNGQIASWGKIFKGEVAVKKAVQGPIGIAKFYGPTWDWLNFWLMTALISLGLAFMNILPIPALDGGHVVLLLIEMITGKPISTKAMERVQTVGMVILLSLMVLIFGNDIIGLFVR